MLASASMAVAAAALPVGGGFLIGRLLLTLVALFWLMSIVVGVRRSASPRGKHARGSAEQTKDALKSVHARRPVVTIDGPHRSDLT